MDQQTALGLLKEGKNIFVTGQAGSGKTYVLNSYIDYLRKHDIEPAITASTGIAATHIGGTTIHSWSGMGIYDRLTPEREDEILAREAVWKRIAKTQVLIIDEISMVAPLFLDAIDQLARTIHEQPDQAFGGMQVVFSGDFFQLPPINKKREEGGKRYAWQARSWLEAEIVPCYLNEQHRQKEGDSLNRILERIRSGEVEDDGLLELQECMDKSLDSSLDPIRLYTHNVDVDTINTEKLSTLETEPHYFEMTTTGRKNQVEKLKQGCLAPEALELREEAQVMFVRNNYEKNYVNGSMGVVVGFSESRGYPLVELYSGGVIEASPEEWSTEQDGKKIASITQVPLRLAWAITIHKSQGMSLDAAEIDLSKCFEVGQGYVALSRVRSLDGLYIRGFNHMATTMDPLTIRVDQRFCELSFEHANTYQAVGAEEHEAKREEWLGRAGGSLEEVAYQTKEEKVRESSAQVTKQLLTEGLSIEEIAEKRELTEGTIVGHLLDLKQSGDELDCSAIEINQEAVDMVREALGELDREDLYDDKGKIRLKPIYTMLDGEVEYDDIKRALLHALEA